MDVASLAQSLIAAKSDQTASALDARMIKMAADSDHAVVELLNAANADMQASTPAGKAPGTGLMIDKIA